MVKKLISPKGTEIVGTLEILMGVALINGAESIDPETGLLDIDYEGTTDIWWDDQRTVQEDSERVFVDANGEQFRERTLQFKEVSDDIEAGE